jgi:hypothetical protein
MDNIIVQKVYDEDGLIELKITASSEFITASQYCYIQDSDLKGNADKIMEYSKDFEKSYYIEFGKKKGQYTPAFSLKFLEADTRGHLKIEVDIEIADNEERAHRCCYYVESEIGLVERFGKLMQELVAGEIDTEIRLCE